MMRIQHTSTHSLPLRWVLLIFLALAFPYHYGFRFLSLTDSILYSLVDGCLFTVLVQLVFRHNLLASSLCYLIIPSLIFAAGWLHWPLALLLVLLVSYSGFTLAQKIPSPGPLPTIFWSPSRIWAH